MRYARTHTIILLASLLVLSGCKVRSEVARVVTDQTRVERTGAAVDTSRTIINAQETISSQADESEEIYTRTQHFDSLGNIRTIQETWRAIGRTELALHERSGSYLSLNGMSAVTTERDSSLVTVVEREDHRADSRPVQGIEWIWVIVGGGLLFLFIIKFVLKR